MRRRPILVNSLLYIVLGFLLLASVFIGFADVPLIIVALLAAGVAIPLEFNKNLERSEARDLAQGKVVAIYGLRYWVILGLSLISAIVGTLVIHAFHSLSDIGIFVASMGMGAIMMAFVNPKYEPKKDVEPF